MNDDAFPGYVAARLAGLPAVAAVTLGGSRAEGRHRPDSDWDFSLYYRGHFDPQALRDLGWPGEVSEVGGWSPGVFNGGAWLEVDGRRTDVHYRDLDVIDRELAGSAVGRFTIEPLLFHLAGIPSYPGGGDVRLRPVSPRPPVTADPVRGPGRAGGGPVRARGPGRPGRVDHEREDPAHPGRAGAGGCVHGRRQP